jgi:ESCRT-II complex subunit VPS36
MMTLTDVYCAYNRARGTDLISPEDLLTAAKQLNTMALGCRLRSFASGLLVLQLDTFSDEEMIKRIVASLKVANADEVCNE